MYLKSNLQRWKKRQGKHEVENRRKENFAFSTRNGLRWRAVKVRWHTALPMGMGLVNRDPRNELCRLRDPVGWAPGGSVGKINAWNWYSGSPWDPSMWGERSGTQKYSFLHNHRLQQRRGFPCFLRHAFNTLSVHRSHPLKTMPLRAWKSATLLLYPLPKRA